VLRALLIRHPHIDKILAGKKKWEIRGSRTSVRETIALVASGSGTVIGVCDLVDCRGPLTAAEYRKNAGKAGMRPSEAKLGWYRQTYAWVIAKPRYLKRPVPDARNIASPWLKTALGRINPFLDELAGYTAAVIEHIKGEPKPTMDEYKDYLEANADYATDLAAMIADFVDYGRTKQRLERLAAKL
jgi:hypothetical protein